MSDTPSPALTRRRFLAAAAAGVLAPHAAAAPADPAGRPFAFTYLCQLPGNYQRVRPRRESGFWSHFNVAVLDPDADGGHLIEAADAPGGGLTITERRAGVIYTNPHHGWGGSYSEVLHPQEGEFTRTSVVDAAGRPISVECAESVLGRRRLEYSLKDGRVRWATRKPKMFGKRTSEKSGVYAVPAGAKADAWLRLRMLCGFRTLPASGAVADAYRNAEQPPQTLRAAADYTGPGRTAFGRRTGRRLMLTYAGSWKEKVRGQPRFFANYREDGSLSDWSYNMAGVFCETAFEFA